MFKVHLEINEREIAYIEVVNLSGDLDGVCRYAVSSREHGFVGYLEHDRREGPYILNAKVSMLINEFEKKMEY